MKFLYNAHVLKIFRRKRFGNLECLTINLNFSFYGFVALCHRC
jgi:hypothetical protein